MTTYKFTVAEHEEYGGKGFRPTWYPNGDPLGGMAVAHDILSHFPGDDGSAEGEFMALGADLYIRGETGYFQRHGNINPPAVHLAAEFGMVWACHVERDRRTAVKPCGLTRDAGLMDTCREIVQLGLKNLKDGYDHLTPPTEEDQERIARWYAKGYKKAERRYARHYAYDVAMQLFGPIEEKADQFLKHADEGQILTVQVNYKTLDVKVMLDYPEEEDFY